MKHIFLIKFYFLSLLLSFVVSDIPIFWCKIKSNGYCVFSNVNLTVENYRFTPTSETPTFVKNVTFEKSHIPILTDDLCNAFPNLEYIDMGQINTRVQEIQENAFYNCTKLKWLRLTNNTIRAIPKDTFRYSQKLEYLYLGINKIQEIDESTFLWLTELKSIYLDTNYLREFKVDWLRNSKDLEKLRLECNDLYELDEVAIIDAFPKLTHVGYSNNELSCARVEKINKAFQRKKFSIYTVFHPRTRYYAMQKLNGVTCLPDQSWSAAFFRRSRDVLGSERSKQMDELKLEKIEKDIQDLKATIKSLDEKLSSLLGMFKSNG